MQDYVEAIEENFTPEQVEEIELALARLKRYGIYYIDVPPGNINCEGLSKTALARGPRVGFNGRGGTRTCSQNIGKNDDSEQAGPIAGTVTDAGALELIALWRSLDDRARDQLLAAARGLARHIKIHQPRVGRVVDAVVIDG